MINSYYLGSTKREVATFHKALELLRETPDRVLFVDDNPGHIERATDLGFMTHLFTSEAAFGLLLSKLGFNPREFDQYA